MAPLDGITYRETAKAHRPWPRVTVTDDGWRQAIDVLANGHCSLLGLWGDAPKVHMALLDETSGDVAVISYACKSGKFPSVAARHPPAIRPERTICDLFGLEAMGTPDPRPWLDLGFWDVRHPLGKQAASTQACPVQIPARARRRPAPNPGRPRACRHHRAGTFPLHRQWRARGAVGAAARLGAQGHRVPDGRRHARGGGDARLAHIWRQHGRLCLCVRTGG